MFETIKNAFKIKEVRQKIFWTLILILVYRIGCFIPVPGINAAVFSESIAGNDFLSIMSAITGGSLSNGTLFAIGISPYINASIIMQLLTVAIPPLERLSKSGEEGKKKVTQITRYVTVALGIIQAVGLLISFKNAEIINLSMLGNATDGTPIAPAWLIYVFVVLVFTAGASFTMWIGERITEKGISNGISMLIFVGILSTAGTAIGRAIAMFGSDVAKVWELIAFLAAVVVIFAAIVFVDSSERKIPVQYAKQVKGRKLYGGQSTHIPIKVNGSGVLPLIFSFSILTFPQMIINTFWAESTAAEWYAKWLGAGTWIYTVLLAAFILFFAYFYNQIQFNVDDISKNIQQNGGFIPGIRPGKPTAEYLGRISNRITLFGAIFLTAVALLPTLIFKAIGGEQLGLINAFSATGMLIVVSVALEFDKALQNQIITRHYKGFLK